jgi:acyl dehydratase
MLSYRYSSNILNIAQANKSMQWNVGDQRSFEHHFTEEQVQAFAELVGDFNPMHVDPEFTRERSLGEPVVHGMLAASFISTLVGCTSLALVRYGSRLKCTGVARFA